MISEAVFKIKNSIKGWSDQTISFSTRDIKSVLIQIKDTQCILRIDGNSEDENLKHIITIWELLVWEDGYFYKPIGYYVDNKERTTDVLLSNKCRITDENWITNAVSLCRNQRQINENILNRYEQIRYLDRKKQSMNATMFSSFFYLISKSYSDINIEHRLVLLMHLCDGFAIKYCNGSDKNNTGNINIILKKSDSGKYKQGAELLGVDKSKAMKALGETRNELTHYVYKDYSLGSYISDPNTETDNMVNLYAFYVLEISFRIAVLEVLGVKVSDAIKNYVMDEHLDWIKLEKHLDEECSIPSNVLHQIVQKMLEGSMNQLT